MAVVEFAVFKFGKKKGLDKEEVLQPTRRARYKKEAGKTELTACNSKQDPKTQSLICQN